ncbi:MAG: LolA family protein [Pyrinomonadaceae bacterium]
MRNYLRLSLTALALVLFFNAFAVTDAKAQGILGDILKRMEAHRQSLTSLEANITMDKFNSQLGEHDVTTGTIMYLPAKGRDALVRIDWMKPVQETLSVVDKKYVLYRPRLNQAIVGKVDDKNKNAKATSALSFMSMSKEQLKANYDLSYLGIETVSSGVETWHIKLVPKTSASYKYAEIWVDKDGMPIQGKVIEPNDDSTTVLLSNLQKNINLDASKFRVNLKGVTIVK